MHATLVVIAVIAIVGYVIGHQLIGEPQRAKRVILLPLVLTVIGGLQLGKAGHHPQAIDVVFIVLGAVIAAGIGLGQGAMMRLESREGSLWGQMPGKSLWLWGALVLSRLIVDVVAGASGAHVAASTAPILLILGVNRLAQALTIVPRAMRAGIPFAPEKDGSSLRGALSARPAGLAQAQNGNDKISPQTPDSRRHPEKVMPAEFAQLCTAVGAALQQRRSSRRAQVTRRGARGRRA